MLCKELYGSNVPHLVIPHEQLHIRCKGLRRSNVPFRSYQHLSVYTPPEYIRAPAGPARSCSAVPYRLAVPFPARTVPLHHQTPFCSFLSSLEFLNTISLHPTSCFTLLFIPLSPRPLRVSRSTGSDPYIW